MDAKRNPPDPLRKCRHGRVYNGTGCHDCLDEFVAGVQAQTKEGGDPAEPRDDSDRYCPEGVCAMLPAGFGPVGGNPRNTALENWFPFSAEERDRLHTENANLRALGKTETIAYDNAGVDPTYVAKLGSTERRIGNPRRIAADTSVNAFARSICAEAANYISELERENANLSRALGKEVNGPRFMGEPVITAPVAWRVWPNSARKFSRGVYEHPTPEDFACWKEDGYEVEPLYAGPPMNNGVVK